MIFVIAIHSSNGQEQEQNEYCESYVVNVQKWRQFMDKSIREIEKLQILDPIEHVNEAHVQENS
jgi:hypothetical protein